MEQLAVPKMRPDFGATFKAQAIRYVELLVCSQAAKDFILNKKIKKQFERAK